MQPPTISGIDLHHVTAEHITSRVQFGTGSVEVNIAMLAFYPEGDTTDARIETMLAIARTLKAQALDLAAQRATPVAPGQWGKGMGTTSTALRTAHDHTLGGAA